MNDLYKEYKAQRKQSLAYYIPTAKSAWQHIKHERALKAWKAEIGATSFYCGHEYTDARGYKYVFKIEPDDNLFWHDIKNGGQGYTFEVLRSNHYKPDFKEHGDFTRHSGDGFKACLDVGTYRDYTLAAFDVPEDFIKQFYDAKNWCKHEAYIRMIASARRAIEADVEQLKTEFNCISVHLYAPDGEAIDSDYLGGCDTDYCTSGNAFFEQGMLDNMKEKAAEHFAAVAPHAIPENFTAAYAI
jgi:hypothetical protein